jgi:hypothetical protein
MDVALWSKDKIPRMVVTDGERVFLYRIAGNALEAEWTYKGDVRGQVFSVQLAELTGDGTLHVVVNRYHEHPSILITSFILGSTGDGKPAVMIPDASEILMAVDKTGDGIKRRRCGPRLHPGTSSEGDVHQDHDPGQQDRTIVRLPNMFRLTGATLSTSRARVARGFVDDQSRMKLR